MPGPRRSIVRLASAFSSEVEILKDGFGVNGKSIMGVMMLAAECGSCITIRAHGADAEQAVEALVAARGRAASGNPERVAHDPRDRRVAGRGLAPRRWSCASISPRCRTAPCGRTRSRTRSQRLRDAVQEVVAAAARSGASGCCRRAGPEEARIFDAQILMAQDEDFLASVRDADPQQPAQRRDRLRVQGAGAPESLVRHGPAAGAPGRSPRHPAADASPS